MKSAPQPAYSFFPLSFHHFTACHTQSRRRISSFAPEISILHSRSSAPASLLSSALPYVSPATPLSTAFTYFRPRWGPQGFQFQRFFPDVSTFRHSGVQTCFQSLTLFYPERCARRAFALLHSAKRQLACFLWFAHSFALCRNQLSSFLWLAHSLCKTTGWGVSV